MTICYATLAPRPPCAPPTTKRSARCAANHSGRQTYPARQGEWIHSEMLKTPVAHGYCARPSSRWRLPVGQQLRNLRPIHHCTRVRGCPHRHPRTQDRRRDPPTGFAAGLPRKYYKFSDLASLFAVTGSLYGKPEFGSRSTRSIAPYTPHRVVHTERRQSAASPQQYLRQLEPTATPNAVTSGLVRQPTQLPGTNAE